MFINNLTAVSKEIRAIKKQLNDSSQSVQIMVVTKNQSNETISELLNHDYQYFGENRVDELVEKKKLFNSAKFAFIAPIQSRKLNKIMNYCDEIHSVMREKEIQILADGSWDGEYYIQVNIDNESQKSGIKEESLMELIDYTNDHYKLPKGLMCIRSLEKESSPIESFESMRNLNQKIKIAYPEYESQLSMGMSNDYREAILYGATVVRLGSKIFGI